MADLVTMLRWQGGRGGELGDGRGDAGGEGVTRLARGGEGGLVLLLRLHF